MPKSKLIGVPKFQQGDQSFYSFDQSFNGLLIDEKFVELYIECTQKCGVTLSGKVPPKLYKTYAIYQILTSIKASSMQSSFCSAEFGVFKGVTSSLITKILKNPDQHYIFDSFEGLSKPTKEDVEGSINPASGGEMSPNFEHIQNLFPNSTLQKCWIPSQLKRVDALFDFVHIDLDLYDPILGALEYTIDKVNPGGVVVVDDYNNRWPGCIQAIREHLSKYQNLYGLHYATLFGNYILIRK